MRDVLVGGVLAVLSLVIEGSPCLALQSHAQQPVELVKQLLDRELAGDGGARDELALLSPGYLVERGITDTSFASEGVFWTADPIVVVESCSIVSADVAEDVVEVFVECRPLLRSVGKGESGRSLVPCDPKPEQIRFLVRRKGTCWFVVDPPDARIELKSLLDFYEDQVAQTTKNFGNNPRVSRDQWDHLNKLRETRDFLKAFAASRRAAQRK